MSSSTLGQPEISRPESAVEDLLAALNVRIVVRGGPVVTDTQEIERSREVAKRLGAPMQGLSEDRLMHLREIQEDVLKRLRKDPVFVQQLATSPEEVADELGLSPPMVPHPASRPTEKTSIVFEPEAVAKEAERVLATLIEEIRERPEVAGAWRTDAVATLLAHHRDVLPSVLSEVIRRVLPSVNLSSRDADLIELAESAINAVAARAEQEEQSEAGPEAP